MGFQNKIIQYNLENRVTELMASTKSLRKTAKALSDETGMEISHHAVKRYLDGVERAKADVVSRSDKLMTKVIEAEFNTVDGCLKCITTLEEICQEARDIGELQTAIMAVDKMFKGLDMLNRILGKYQVPGAVSNNITQNNVIVSIDQKVKEYEDYFATLEGQVNSNSIGEPIYTTQADT